MKPRARWNPGLGWTVDLKTDREFIGKAGTS